MTRKELLDSLASSVCPNCGGPKTERMTFCRADYYALPKVMRQALYHRFGAGYEEAFQSAADFLLELSRSFGLPPHLIGEPSDQRHPAASPDATPPTATPDQQTTLFRDEGGAQWTL